MIDFIFDGVSGLVSVLGLVRSEASNFRFDKTPPNNKKL